MANPQPPYWGREGNGSGETEVLYGVWGDSQDGAGVIGTTLGGANQPGGVVGVSHNQGTGVLGLAGPGGTGVHGTADKGDGVSGVSYGGTGVTARSYNGAGLSSTGTSVGVEGYGDRAGVHGWCTEGIGVNGASKQGIGVNGYSDTIGVQGSGLNSGVRGVSREVGVRGEGDGAGVLGKGTNCGVAAFNFKNSNAAYLASACCAAYFTGEVAVIGFLSKSGGGFRIDHPAHPSEKFLAHSFVESSEMKNVYDGVAILNSKGEATVRLPAWFEHLNGDFRYQLTPIGGPAPGLHIAREIEGNRFKIAGGARGMKISWQVTGVRKDAWASANPFKVEQKKSSAERGHFLHPELHGASGEQSIAALRHPVR